jgi:hypothetical protein
MELSINIDSTVNRKLHPPEHPFAHAAFNPPGLAMTDRA